MATTRAVVDFAPGEIFYTLLTNISKKRINISKHMVVAHVMNPPDIIATTKIKLVDCDENNSSDMPAETRIINETSSPLHTVN